MILANFVPPNPLPPDYPNYPVALPQPPDVSPGWVERIILPDQAAGLASFNLVAVGGENWAQLEQLKLQFSTDATVANRLVEVRYMDSIQGGRVIYSAITEINQAANTIADVCFAVEETTLTVIAQNHFRVRIPYLKCAPGWLIRVQLNNVQVGDQCTGIFAMVRKWSSKRLPALAGL